VRVYAISIQPCRQSRPRPNFRSLRPPCFEFQPFCCPSISQHFSLEPLPVKAQSATGETAPKPPKQAPTSSPATQPATPQAHAVPPPTSAYKTTSASAQSAKSQHGPARIKAGRMEDVPVPRRAQASSQGRPIIYTVAEEIIDGHAIEVGTEQRRTAARILRSRGLGISLLGRARFLL
jgi:hypothetical protein